MARNIGPGWCPFAEQQYSPNYTAGRKLGTTVYHPLAVVEHIAQGAFQGSVDWLCNPKSRVSAHFMVGKQGQLTQMVSVLDTAYTNGLAWLNPGWQDPEGNKVTPSWTGLIPGVNPIWYTLGVEHEGNSGELWTPGETATDIRLLRWLRQTFGFVYQRHVSLIGHYEISPVARAHCPGTGIPWDVLAHEANQDTTVDYVALWGSQWPYNPLYGIAVEWRKRAETLGAAVSDEHDDGKYVVRWFERGAVAYDPKTGTLKSYVVQP